MLFLALLAVTLGGCLDNGSNNPDPVDGGGPGVAPSGALVVVADVDTGVNPYHLEFRDNRPIAWTHPSTYIPGFPADVQALRLSLEVEDYNMAVLADCEVWSSVEPETLYWIPGTRIIGAITFSPGRTDCDQGTLPGSILDRGGHGTMTTSRVAGSESSLCPECRIVSIQGFTDDSMVWASEQPWIDLQTNSWGDLPMSYLESLAPEGSAGLLGNDRSQVVAAAKRHAIFVAGGNGLAGFFGVTGHPAYFDNIAGGDGIIMVGGHDNGYYTPWTMTMPHIVADANAHPAAEYDSVDARDERGGGGTSGATPFAAGTFARMLMEVRQAVGDTGVGVRDGNIVVAADDMAPATGPLADGFLSLEEAKMLFYHTANPRPVEDGHWDGPKCSGADCIVGGLGIYSSVPVEWSSFPETLPLYYYVGYGQVGNLTLWDHISAALGETEIPDRATEDSFFMADTTARRTLDENQP